jgi:predicted  nucleic acid-binding Zn-ribbon protein
MRKPSRRPARKADTEVLVSEISSLRDSLELKQELTNLRLEVAQLRQELAAIRRRPQGVPIKKRASTFSDREVQD